jgi:hypothetical protein
LTGFSRRLLIFAALGLVSAASAQFGFGPPGGGSDWMGNLFQRVASGVIEDVNPVKGYLQVGTPGRSSRVVVVGAATKITRLAEAPLSELKVGDEISVSGLPLAVAADRVRVGPTMTMADVFRALQEGEKPPEGASPAALPPAGPAAGGPPGGFRRPPTVTVSGTVKSLAPLVVIVAGVGEVAVTLPPEARLLRRAEGDLSAAAAGQEVIALGRPNDDGYLAATEVHLGESLSFGRMSPGPEMGPPVAPATPPPTPAGPRPAGRHGGKRG